MDRIKIGLWDRLKLWWYVKVRGYEVRLVSDPPLVVRSPKAGRVPL